MPAPCAAGAILWSQNNSEKYLLHPLDNYTMKYKIHRVAGTHVAEARHNKETAMLATIALCTVFATLALCLTAFAVHAAAYIITNFRNA